ncbi:porin [Burkholderia cepacia]|uniref:porin n=1 Tax=Burkholderia cepacia TaxID=292 RepID=UPI002AB60FA2|nr:porin [Burkholderia cepacia]
MKMKLVAVAACATASMVAHAQSAVTLYGILDEGVNWTSNSNGAHQYNMTSGVASGSRWGLRGSEDLGGGLKAVFVLENGFDVGSGALGQGGRMFGRQAYVGLSSSRLGALTAGRQYDSVVDTLAIYELFAQMGGYVFARPGDIDNLNNAHRVNNALKYTGNFGGLVITGLYSLGGVAGDASRNQIWSAGASYSTGPFSVGAAYMNVRNPNTSFFSDSSSVATANNVSGPVYAGYASAHTYEVLAGAARYIAGPATMAVTFSNVRFEGLGDTSSGPNLLHYGGEAVFNSIEGNATYRITPALLVGLGYNYTRNAGASGRSGAGYSQVMGGVDYSLSKRTDVYLVGTWQKASGVDSTGKAAVAAINGPLSPSSSNQQSYVRIAIRHRF